MSPNKIRNLFVVDWKNTPIYEIDRLFKNTEAEYEWVIYNCHEKNYTSNGIFNRYISYFFAAIHILKNKKQFDNIIIWQQMIGFILCLFPKFYSRPKLIITTLLYSPSRAKDSFLRMFLLKNALLKSDALLYFSEQMAQDVRRCYPKWASKVYSTYLPINHTNGERKIKENHNESHRNSVFAGGRSDRDFETVIKAFSNTDVPVIIVCPKIYYFKSPELITPNFKIIRDVTEREFYSLVLSSNIIVIALENEYSSCGQLLFTFCMKNEIAIIATECFGTIDYITNNDNGILVPIKNEKAIYDAYEKINTNASLRRRLVKRSKDISTKMTFDNYLKKIDIIIQSIK